MISTLYSLIENIRNRLGGAIKQAGETISERYAGGGPKHNYVMFIRVKYRRSDERGVIRETEHDDHFTAATDEVTNELVDDALQGFLQWYDDEYEGVTIEVDGHENVRVRLYENTLLGALSVLEASLPSDFLARGSWETCFATLASIPEANVGSYEYEDSDADDGDDDDEEDDDDGNDEGNKRGRGERSNKARDARTQHRDSAPSQSETSSSSMSGTSVNRRKSVANLSAHSFLDQKRLGPFCPNTEVANEIDTLDMVDDEERHQWVRAFFAKHVVPTLISCDDDSFDDNKCEPLSVLPLSDANIRLHNILTN